MIRLEQIRAALAAKVSGIADIGVVHDYERYADTDAKFQELYTSQIGGKKQLRGWYLRRMSTEETSAAMGDYENAHGWILRGFMAIDDAHASEKVFDGLVESVRDAFRADQTLGGLIASIFSPQGVGPRLDESVPVLFGRVLCHSARIQLTTWYAF